MSDPNIERKVSEIIAEQLGIAEDDIALDSTLSGDLGADTLDFIELLMALEEEFEIEIGDDVASRLETVGNLVEHVARQSSS